MPTDTFDKNLKTKRLIVFIIAIIVIVLGVGAVVFISSNSDKNSNQSSNNSKNNIFSNSLTQNLPEFADFIKNPSDTFIIKLEDYSKITRATPQYGKSLQCSHPGAHIHFTAQGAPYYVDIVSPVDGYISMIDKCFDLGSGSGTPQDKFGISIAFAKSQGKSISFSFSIEPFSGQLCKNNPSYYLQYVLVKENEEVKKGQVIARMPKLSTKDDSTHVHFNLTMDGDNTPICPNIFTKDVEKDFFDMNDTPLTCGNDPVPQTFCDTPSEGEDLTNLN